MNNSYAKATELLNEFYELLDSLEIDSNSADEIERLFNEYGSTMYVVGRNRSK